jgi:hypothetical protein
MSTTNRPTSRPQPERGSATHLSAEEREALDRIRKRAARKREGALRRFGKNPPLFFWWGCW